MKDPPFPRRNQSSDRPIYSNISPSDMFEEVICDAGTTVALCDLCGRIHYNGTGEYMDEGELEEIQERKKSDSETYVEHNGQVHFGVIDDCQIVIGCVCNGMTWYEQFFWSERRAISAYISRRAKRVLERAYQNVHNAEEIRKALALLEK